MEALLQEQQSPWKIFYLIFLVEKREQKSDVKVKVCKVAVV